MQQRNAVKDDGMIYPWQQPQWQQFQRMRQDDRLPHAILLTGMLGLGQDGFAEELAKSLLCQQPGSEGFACGNCHLCRINKADTHPDIRRLSPEKPGQAIKVDQVRDIIEFVQQSSLQGRSRVVIINPANNLNLNAANALLKTLEEPPEGAHIILISDQIKALLPTIVSRCQRINFNRPASLQAEEWLREHIKGEGDISLLLKLAHGAPLAAISLNQDDFLKTRHVLYSSLVDIKNQQGDLLKVAVSYKDANSLQFIDMFLSWLMDLSQIQLGITYVVNDDFNQSLVNLAKKSSIEASMKLINYLLQARKILLAGVSLNKQLLVESVLIKWCES